ncbi:LOW QUALITY PROTEIN: OR4B1 isoform 1 [Pongo abelii]|uniref:OR4B1 isoform 1 n=1 Tax=Pongo abelii TaxID=9601 RepID=A0A2J8WEL9_PONAB|nr:LOW QUALITY PROTEIN: OR4B1 isoform 1 [Pongo abelii]
MASINNVTESMITSLFQDPAVWRVCFVVFLPVYAMEVGNGLIVLTVSISKSVHSPVYFFLSYLSLVEISYFTVVPKFITDLLVKIKAISLEGCLAQIFLHFFGIPWIFLLPLMTNDQYMANCKLYYYTTIMSCLCHLLVAGFWLRGIIHSMVQILVSVQLSFCGPNMIDHSFCDLQVLFKLACTDTFVEGVIVMANSELVSVFFLILVSSYIIILVNLRNHSAEGRCKALSTCASFLYFELAIFLYV